MKNTTKFPRLRLFIFSGSRWVKSANVEYNPVRAVKWRKHFFPRVFGVFSKRVIHRAAISGDFHFGRRLPRGTRSPAYSTIPEICHQPLLPNNILWTFKNNSRSGTEGKGFYWIVNPGIYHQNTLLVMKNPEIRKKITEDPQFQKFKATFQILLRKRVFLGEGIFQKSLTALCFGTRFFWDRNPGFLSTFCQKFWIKELKFQNTGLVFFKRVFKSR